MTLHTRELIEVFLKTLTRSPLSTTLEILALTLEIRIHSVHIKPQVRHLFVICFVGVLLII